MTIDIIWPRFGYVPAERAFAVVAYLSGENGPASGADVLWEIGMPDGKLSRPVKTDENGLAAITLTASGPGPIFVEASRPDGGVSACSYYATDIEAGARPVPSFSLASHVPLADPSQEPRPRDVRAISRPSQQPPARATDIRIDNRCARVVPLPPVDFDDPSTFIAASVVVHNDYGHGLKGRTVRFTAKGVNKGKVRIFNRQRQDKTEEDEFGFAYADLQTDENGEARAIIFGGVSLIFALEARFEKTNSQLQVVFDAGLVGNLAPLQFINYGQRVQIREGEYALRVNVSDDLVDDADCAIFLNDHLIGTSVYKELKRSFDVPLIFLNRTAEDNLNVLRYFVQTSVGSVSSSLERRFEASGIPTALPDPKLNSTVLPPELDFPVGQTLTEGDIILNDGVVTVAIPYYDERSYGDRIDLALYLNGYEPGTDSRKAEIHYFCYVLTPETGAVKWPAQPKCREAGIDTTTRDATVVKISGRYFYGFARGKTKNKQKLYISYQINQGIPSNPLSKFIDVGYPSRRFT